MESLKKILAAIDFSDYSLSTLRYTLGLAEGMKAEVVVVNVINDRDISAVRMAEQYSDEISVEKYIENQKKERSRRLEQLLRDARCGHIPVSMTFRIGPPAYEILEAVKETQADLVVVGTKGRSNLASAFFGSVAETVHRRSLVNVLSIRGPEHAELVCKLEA